MYNIFLYMYVVMWMYVPFHSFDPHRKFSFVLGRDTSIDCRISRNATNMAPDSWPATPNPQSSPPSLRKRSGVLVLVLVLVLVDCNPYPCDMYQYLP